MLHSVLAGVVELTAPDNLAVFLPFRFLDFLSAAPILLLGDSYMSNLVIYTLDTLERGSLSL